MSSILFLLQGCDAKSVHLTLSDEKEIKMRKAVSLVFVCSDRVFIIKRQNYLRFFPGYTAFPGGKVDKEDGDCLWQAAKREAREELGVELDQLIGEGLISKATKIAKATSPEFNPYRFETYFFLLRCHQPIKFLLDSYEAAMGKWSVAEHILEDYQKGKILLVEPIKAILSLIANGIDEDIFIDFDEEKVKSPPSIEPLVGLIQVMPLSQTLPPANRTNCFVIGKKNSVVIDPSPKNEQELRDLRNYLNQFQIRSIIISHHHADHHQYAPDLARTLAVPILISRDSHQRICSKQTDYFKGVSLEWLEQDKVVGYWNEEPIKSYWIPGHDEGHFGFAPASLSWFIVGDLFQGIGTVVVGGDEGSMSKYLQSLRMVIDLNPACVIPSHGIALGGTYILQKTLKHREEREKQILALHQQGKSLEQMTALIYFDIPKSLHPYAKANIKSHLLKLQEEMKL